MKNDIDRREFLKRAGGAAMVMGGLASLTGCKGSSASTGAADSADEGMTYRINPGNGDKVSILGYGCMRWPMIKDEDDREGRGRSFVCNLFVFFRSSYNKF